MSKWYWSYDDYKDDPNNLDTNELPRIEKVMIAAPFPSSFASSQEFFHALFRLKFPGYGLGGLDDHPETDDGSTLMVESVEIPERDKDRYLVVREAGGELKLLDDFVSGTASNAIAHIKLQGTNIYYYDGHGSVVREKGVEAR